MSVYQGAYNCPVCGSPLTNGYCYHCGKQIFQSHPSTQYGWGDTPPPPPPSTAETVPTQPGTMFSGRPQPPGGIQPRAKKSLFIVTAIAVLVLLIGGGLFWQISATNQRNEQIQATATAQANEHVTATARAQAAAATATAIPLHDNFVPDGATATLALSDPLTATDKWQTSAPSGGGTCQFSSTENGYVIHTPTTSYMECEATPVGASYSDLTFQVNMKILQGDCGGLSLRDAGASNYNEYVAMVCSDGSYFVYATDQTGNIPNQHPLANGTAVNLSSTKMTTLDFVAYGKTLSFYLGGNKLTSISDGTYTQKGSVGLVAFPENNPTDVLFQDAKVWSLSPQ